MKQPPPCLPMDRARAKACLAANLSLPGLGSLHVGRRVGWAQLALAAGGFVLTLTFGGWLVAEWARARELPFLPVLERGEWPPGLLRHLLVGLGGLALFATALGWSLITSWLVYREARANEGG